MGNGEVQRGKRMDVAAKSHLRTFCASCGFVAEGGGDLTLARLLDAGKLAAGWIAPASFPFLLPGARDP